MAVASNDQRLAAHLGAPFSRPGQNKTPLSFRMLPEGGMVVISADGRKLWFTLEEVNTARRELGLQEFKPPLKPREKKEENGRQPDITSRPPPGNRDGKSEMIVLPPELKHLEQKAHVKIRRP